MKRKLITALLSLCMMMTSMSSVTFATNQNIFTDVNGDDWFYDEVLYVMDNGIMNGTSGTTFAPNENTSRGMIVTILWRMEGRPIVEGTQFDDVLEGQYYTDAVLWASQNGIVNGYGDNKFGPDDLITREQLAAILYRYADYLKYDLSEVADLSQFADADSISDYAQKAFAYVVAKGLIKGMDNDTLAPLGKATRAQVATIIYRMNEKNETPEDSEDSKKEYTVTFDYNILGKGTYHTATVAEGEKVIKPADPRLNGYNFAGWYLLAEDEVEFNFRTVITSDITLYAKWGKIAGTIGGGGSKHSHSYSNWTSNEDGTHTCKCSCDDTKTENCTVEATELPVKNGNGKFTYTCTVCGEFESEELLIYNAGQLVQLSENINSGAVSYDGVEIVIMNDIDMTDVEWTPITLSAYKNNTIFYLDGRDNKLTNMTEMLIGGASQGVPSITVKNLTIADSTIEHDKDDQAGNTGVAAFVGHLDGGVEEVVLENLKLENSSVEGGHWTGAIVGYAAGYNGTDGPAFLNVLINECSVTESDITGKGSVGGIIGHATGSAWTKVTINDSTVTGNTIQSTGDSDNKAGSVLATVGVAGLPTTVNGETHTGGTYVNNTVAEDNTVVSNGVTINTIYGRQGNPLGKLVIDGTIIFVPEGITGTDTGFVQLDEFNFEILSADGLKIFRDNVNAGTTYENATVMLGSDIDLNNEVWTPIGPNADASNKFRGTFDGNGYTITNLKIDTTEPVAYQATGLFGALNGTVKNLVIDGADINGLTEGSATDNGIAVVAGSIYTSGTIENVTVKNATVKGNRYVGGIVGYLSGNVVDCSVNDVELIAVPDNLSGDYDNGDKVGGIAGYINADTDVGIDGCTVTDVQITAYRDAGGVAGAGYVCDEVVNNTVDNLDITIDQNTNFYEVKPANAKAIVGRVLGGTVNDTNVSSNVTINRTPITVTDSETLINIIADAEPGENTIIELAAGTYAAPKIEVQSGKEITIVPVEGAEVIFDGQFFVTAKLTIKDITLTNENATSDGISKARDNCIYVQSEGEVYCEGVTFEIKKATAITSWWGTGDWTDIIVKDCVFNCNSNRPLQSEGPITVEGCVFNNPYRYALQMTANDSEINFKNNTINKTEDNEKPVYAIQLTNDYGNSNLVINGEGNKIKRTAGNYEDALYVWEPGFGISNGFVDINTITLNAEDGELKALIEDELYVTENGGVSVTTVEEFEELADKNITVIIPEGEELTLDLTGETVTNSVAKGTAIKNNGTLTITGGTYLNEYYQSQGSHIIVNSENATLTIDGGTFGSDNNSGNAIRNEGGTVVINDGTFSSSDRDLHPDVWAYVFNCVGGTMTINDANVECKANGMFAAINDGIITVNGGNYILEGADNNYYMCYAPSGKINLVGGSFTYNGSNNCIWPVAAGSEDNVTISDDCELLGNYWDEYLN